jgi:hypothetical protein
MRPSVPGPASPPVAVARDTHRALPTPAEKFIFLIAILVCFTASPDLLIKLGWDYAGDSGSFISRFHPATWLLLPVILLATMRSGNPLLYLDVVAARPIMAASLALLLFDLVWAIAFVQQPFTPLLETFIIPILGFYLIREYDAAMKRRIALLVHVCMIANALLGLVERVLRIHIVSTNLYEDAVFRSSALLGHPLANATVTCLYLLTLAVGGGRDLPAWSRLIVFGLEFLALTAFGGRTALVVAIAGLPVVAAAWLWRVRLGERISQTVMKVWLVGVPLLIGAAWGLYALGFFDDLLIRFIDDYGSARTRAILTTIVGHFPWHDLMFGPDTINVRRYAILEGSELGIESYWFATLLLYGVLGAVPLWIAGFGISLELFLASRLGSALVLAAFWVIASGSNSISTKGLALLMLDVFLLCMLRPLPPAPAPGPVPVRMPPAPTTTPLLRQGRPGRPAGAFRAAR